MRQRRLESDAERCCSRDRRHSGGFLLRIMPPSWHPVPACTPRLRCRRAVLNCSSDDAAAIRKSGLEIKNHCTLEAVSWQKPAAIPKLTPSNQESLHARGHFRANHAVIPKSGPEIKNHCTQKGLNGENPAAIPKFGLEIRNHCTLEVVSGQKPAAIPKSGLEIKNHCTLDGVSGQKLTSIHKSGLEIKNRCSSGFATTVCRRAILLYCSEE